MPLCECKKIITRLTTAIKVIEQKMECDADEDAAKIAGYQLDFLKQIKLKLDEWGLCNCYDGQSLRSVKWIVDRNYDRYLSNDIMPRDVHTQFAVVKEYVKNIV